MKKVSYIAKDASIGYGNNSYKVVTHDKVLELVRPHLIDEGILVVPSQIGNGLYTEGKTKNGGDKWRYDGKYSISFIDIDEPSSIIVVENEVSAEAMDDKAPSKAITIATKNAIIKVFMLETGEDNSEEGTKNTIDAKQSSMINQLIVDTDTDIEKFCGAYNIQKLSDLPSGMFSQALAQLQKKMKGKADAIKNTNN